MEVNHSMKLIMGPVLNTVRHLVTYFCIILNIPFFLPLENNLCHRIYLTEIQNTFECDRYFPKIDMNEYKEINDENVSSEEQVENGVKYSFKVYEKK